MQHEAQLLCTACGTAVSSGAARCPKCGQALALGTAPALGSPLPGTAGSKPELPGIGLNMGASRLALLGTIRARRRSERTKLVVALIVGPLAIVLLAGLAWKLVVGRDSATGAGSGVPSAPSASPIASSTVLSEFARLDQPALLSRARARAVSWHPEALLVAVEATPVSAGRVDLRSGAQLSYDFGKPAGKRLGPGARVASERLVVSVGEQGLAASERTAGAARAVADPDCPLEEAFRQATAAGLSSSSALKMRYALSDTFDRAVWTVSEIEEPKRTRYLDGSNCVILVR